MNPMTRMTARQQLDRLAYVHEWSNALLGRLLDASLSKGLSDEQTFEVAQRAGDDACLSVLRGGDPELDRRFAAAFGFESVDALQAFEAAQSTPPAAAGVQAECAAPRSR